MMEPLDSHPVVLNDGDYYLTQRMNAHYLSQRRSESFQENFLDKNPQFALDLRVSVELEPATE